ncbi:hypothetical protein JCM16358_01850 [Halanaerocella petrolearia]
MSMPEIPDREEEEALADLLESIALEETSLAHFMNAEAEKIQAIVQMMMDQGMSPEEVIDFQKSVSKVMRTPIKKEMLLQFKLEDILEYKRELETTTSTTSSTTSSTTTSTSSTTSTTTVAPEMCECCIAGSGSATPKEGNQFGGNLGGQRVVLDELSICTDATEAPTERELECNCNDSVAGTSQFVYKIQETTEGNVDLIINPESLAIECLADLTEEEAEIRITGEGTLNGEDVTFVFEAQDLKPPAANDELSMIIRNANTNQVLHTTNGFIPLNGDLAIGTCA